MHKLLTDTAEHPSVWPGRLRAQAVRATAASVAAVLLLLNYVAFRGDAANCWDSPAILLLLLSGTIAANSTLLRTRTVSVASVFAAPLFLFHTGYYIPVRLGIARALSHMPPVHGYGAGRAMTVFCAAILALETGCLAAAFLSVRDAGSTPRQEEWRKTALHSGWLITGFSSVSLLIFMIQVGGPLALLRVSYTDLFAFFATADPRFAFTSLWFAPPGLLLWRVGNMNQRTTSHAGTWLWWLAAGLLLLPWLLIGARGPSFLFAIAMLYLSQIERGKCRRGRTIAVAGVLILAAPLIVAYRNRPVGDRLRGIEGAHVSPVQFLLEIGSVYRPYFGMIEMMESGQQEYLHGASYGTAARSLIPNLGESERSASASYYRTSTWFNYRLSPGDSVRNIGIGSSMIGEQFANFGYFGVVGVFACIGFVVVSLETRAVVQRSVLARALLVILILPLCWYIRDDIYGCIRMFVWPSAVMGLVRLCRLPLRSPDDSSYGPTAAQSR